MIRKKVWVVADRDRIICPSCSGVDEKSALDYAAAFVGSTPSWLKRKGYSVHAATLVVKDLVHAPYKPTKSKRTP